MEERTGQTPDERHELGKRRREQAPLASHAAWSPPRDRPDPVALLASQDAGRRPELVPIRHQRMAESTFAFYRGSAILMAHDLATTPISGLRTQLCGDAHLANFGLFGSPERALVFDVNDFDETLLGPWEWDLKRLVASVVLAARDNGFGHKAARAAAATAVSTYVSAMATFADMPWINVWYQEHRADDFVAFAETERRLSRKQTQNLAKYEAGVIDAARARDSHGALATLARRVNGAYRFVASPPFIVPLAEFAGSERAARLHEEALAALAGYRASLPDARRFLAERYRVIDIALKVVGVGSVGTLCFVILLEGNDARDVLILQAKESQPSVLEPYLAPSPYAHQGQRIVEGQRLMQAVSDVFLGWTRDASGHDYYLRQLRNMKLSLPIRHYDPEAIGLYAGLCGGVLATAHARTGDAAGIAGYLGSGEAFARALVEFAERYADQAEHDYAAFLAAIKAGRVQTTAA